MKPRHHFERAFVIAAFLGVALSSLGSTRSLNFPAPALLFIAVPIVFCCVWALVIRMALVALLFGGVCALSLLAQLAAPSANTGPFGLSILLLCSICCFDLWQVWRQRPNRQSRVTRSGHPERF